MTSLNEWKKEENSNGCPSCSLWFRLKRLACNHRFHCYKHLLLCTKDQEPKRSNCSQEDLWRRNIVFKETSKPKKKKKVGKHKQQQSSRHRLRRRSRSNNLDQTPGRHTQTSHFPRMCPGTLPHSRTSKRSPWLARKSKKPAAVPGAWADWKTTFYPQQPAH